MDMTIIDFNPQLELTLMTETDIVCEIVDLEADIFYSGDYADGSLAARLVELYGMLDLIRS